MLESLVYSDTSTKLHGCLSTVANDSGTENPNEQLLLIDEKTLTKKAGKCDTVTASEKAQTTVMTVEAQIHNAPIDAL